MNEELINYVDMIEEISEVNELLNEDFVTTALDDIVKLAVRSDVPDAIARKLIVKLQAIAATFALRATFYANVQKGKVGSVEYQRKNLYYTLAAETDKIVAALKYLVRI